MGNAFNYSLWKILSSKLHNSELHALYSSLRQRHYFSVSYVVRLTDVLEIPASCFGCVQYNCVVQLWKMKVITLANNLILNILSVKLKIFRQYGTFGILTKAKSSRLLIFQMSNAK